MNEKHYKEKLSGFVNHALEHDERQTVAEHLLQCAECRAEHDEIKLGASLASALKQTDAPENLWHKIENALDKKQEKAALLPNLAFFNLRVLAAACIPFGILTALAFILYVNIFVGKSPEIVEQKPTPVLRENANLSPVVQVPNSPNTNVQNPANAQIQTADANSQIAPGVNPSAPQKQRNEAVVAPNNLPSWTVETLAGTPKAGNQIIAENGKLAVGEFLETDANSKAKIQVANIGNVEIAPNSRVKLVNTKATEHRLSLEKGALKAKILAPPRLFIVDTPSAVAVDLGCEYTLEVDAAGNGRLHVTAGFVALERGGREVIVPAGAIALTRKGKGVGTPFSEDASAAFQNALYKFDFAGGGSAALNVIIKESSLYDSLTLWHLLSRTPKAERTKVFDALEAQIKPPVNVTREGILRLDKKMLGAWWKEIETVWFE
jgi:hypothetical protein